MAATYQVGDKVQLVGFVDCFGVYHPTVRGLTVETATEIVTTSMPPYTRIKAVTADGGYVEGADRFFAPDDAKVCSQCGAATADTAMGGICRVCINAPIPDMAHYRAWREQTEVCGSEYGIRMRYYREHSHPKSWLYHT